MKDDNKIRLTEGEGEEFEGEEQFDEDLIARLITRCEISSELPLKEILKCSNIVYMLGDSIGLLIRDANIFVYSFPQVKQHVLVKYVPHDESPASGEESNAESEPEDVLFIIKEEDLFCIKSARFDLYFQMFDENDPNLPKTYDKLKSM